MRFTVAPFFPSLALVATLATAGCSASGQTPEQAAGGRGGNGAARRSRRDGEGRTEIDAAGHQRHRHRRGLLQRRGPPADHRRADVGRLQGRRRRHRRAKSSSRSTSGRSSRRCSRRRPTSRVTRRRRPTPDRAPRAIRICSPAGSRRRSRPISRARRPKRSTPPSQADRAAVENAKVQLQYATIMAPMSGRTGALMVHEGNLVRANDTTPLVVINQISPIYVSFGIPEGQLPDLKRYMAQGSVAVEATPPGETTTSQGPHYLHRQRRRSDDRPNQGQGVVSERRSPSLAGAVRQRDADAEGRIQTRLSCRRRPSRTGSRATTCSC